MRILLVPVVSIIGRNPPSTQDRAEELPIPVRHGKSNIKPNKFLKGLKYASRLFAVLNGVGSGYWKTENPHAPMRPYTKGLLNALRVFHGASTLGAVGVSLSRGLNEGWAEALMEAILSGGLYMGSEFVTPVLMRKFGLPTTPAEHLRVDAADTLIQRHGELLEELKKENLSGESKTDSRELQLKLARLRSDYHKFLYSSIKDMRVRHEWRERIYPSNQALWIQFDEMGGPWRFPMMWPQYELYEIVNGINHFAQMSPKEQTANMWRLRNLGSQYPARVEETQGIEGFDRTEFDAAGQTLAQLQAKYRRLLN
jgi:hypothetical protein